MTLAQYEFQYGSLVFGGPTGSSVGVGVSKVVGISGLPGIATNDLDRTRLDGSWAGLILGRTRSIHFDLEIVNLGLGSSFQTEVETVAQAFKLQSVPQPLSMWWPGWTAARRSYCRPVRADFPYDNLAGVAIVSAPVQLDAPDPLVYSDAAHTAGPALSVSVTNAGDYAVGAGPTAGMAVITTSGGGTITGPSGEHLVLTGGGPYTIDLGNHQVTGAGGYPDLVQPAGFFTIPPGTSTISISSGTLSVSWRDAWLS